MFVPVKQWTDLKGYRLILNYKGLPYKTEWVEYPDIEALCKKLGVPPGGAHADGTPFYTLPVIHDKSTNTSISESMAIAHYLDKTYPHTPSVIPAGTGALQAATEFALQQAFLGHLLPVIVLPNLKQLNPCSQGFYRRAREADLGRLEDLAPTAASQDEAWKKVQDGLSKVAKWMERFEDGQEGKFIMGDSMSFVDCIIAARLLWMKKVLGDKSPQWMQVMTWDGGRWARYIGRFQKYEIVH